MLQPQLRWTWTEGSTVKKEASIDAGKWTDWEWLKTEEMYEPHWMMMLHRKKAGWSTWKSLPGWTGSRLMLTNGPHEIPDDVSVDAGRTTDCSSLNFLVSSSGYAGAMVLAKQVIATG